MSDPIARQDRHEARPDHNDVQQLAAAQRDGAQAMRELKTSIDAFPGACQKAVCDTFDHVAPPAGMGVGVGIVLLFAAKVAAAWVIHRINRPPDEGKPR